MVPLVSSCILQKLTFSKNQILYPWNIMSKTINVVMCILCTQVKPRLVTFWYLKFSKNDEVMRDKASVLLLCTPLTLLHPQIPDSPSSF